MNRRIVRALTVIGLAFAVLPMAAAPAAATPSRGPASQSPSSAGLHPVLERVAAELGSFDASGTLEPNDTVTWASEGRGFHAQGTLGNGDYDDVYAMDLEGGDRLSVTLDGATSTDVDVYLFGSALLDPEVSAPVAASTHASFPEQLDYIVPANGSGRYYVDLLSVSGAGSYSLDVRARSGLALKWSVASRVVPYRSSIELTGSVRPIAAGHAPPDSVRIYRSYDAVNWSAVSTVQVGSGGMVRFVDPRPVTRRTYFRMLFPGDATFARAEAVSSVKPRILFSRYRLPTAVALLRPFSTEFTFYPQHPRGGHSIKIEALRLEHGRWVRYQSVWAAVRDNAYGGSAASAQLVIRGRGTWLVRAWHPDDGFHASTYSPGRTYVVR